MPGEMRDDFAAAIQELAGGAEGNAGEGGKPEGTEKQGELGTGETKPDGTAGEAKLDGKVSSEQKNEVSADGQQEQKEVKKEEKSVAKTKAPASWSPEEREGWDDMKPAHQAAILRRDRQVDEALRVSHSAREFAATFEKVCAPYQAYIAQEGSNPLQAVQNMFQTAHILNSAPPGRKAAEVARMILHFGVDVPMLDQAITAMVKNQPLPGSPQDSIMTAIDQRLKPVTDFMSQMTSQQSSAQNTVRSAVEQEWQKFAEDPKNEFANDVREDMADIFDAATRRGVQMDLQTAYNRAILLHPSISKVVEQRKLAQTAAQQTAAAKRAKEAGASISGSGAPSRGKEEGEGNLRDDIRSSVESLSR